MAETTRQLIAAISGALAIGISLIVARLSTNTSPFLIIAIMAVVALYVILVMTSGFQFIGLQKHLREDWQDRLYRFLSQHEYQKMVTVPAGRAEKTFKLAAVIGTISIVLLSIAVSYTALSSFEIRAKPKGDAVQQSEQTDVSSTNSTAPTSPSKATPP